VRARGRVARHALGPLDAEVADGGEQDPSLDAVVAPGVVDAADDPVEVLLAAQPDERGVVRGGDQLDVDGAVAGAARQVLVGDVAVVVAGADDAGREVVGAQEVEEVRVGEAVRRLEDALRDGQSVALGEPPDEVRRSGPLEVDVELGLRDQSVGPQTYRFWRL